MYDAEVLFYLAMAPTLFAATLGFALYKTVRSILAKDKKRAAICAGIGVLWLAVTAVVVGIVFFMSAAHSSVATELRMTAGVYFVVGMIVIVVLSRLGRNVTPPE